jgi:hypothetical protein
MTEELLRSSLLRGLIGSCPVQASRVTREMTATWSGNPCCYDASHAVGRGRPIQHDVGVRPDGVDAGLSCEVKWLTVANPSVVAQDILKLAISRSTAAEGQAMRTFLLLGGNLRAISNTLASLRSAGFNLRWSPAGRGPDSKPPPTTIRISTGIFSHSLPRSAVEALISWGNSPRHVRRCPPTWASIRASLRERWYRNVVVDGKSTSWRLLLWEIDHRSVTNQSQLSWQDIVVGHFSRQC